MTAPEAPLPPSHNRYFFEKFGITERLLERCLGEALSAGGDYADLYFEYLATSSLSIDESIVKSAVQGVSLGVGVRVIAGERPGYAYSDDLSPDKIRRASRVAACDVALACPPRRRRNKVRLRVSRAEGLTL